MNDYHLQHMLQKYMFDNELYPVAKSIALCGKGVIPVIGHKAGVFVMSNGEKADYFGHTHCGNAWACPVCERKLMEVYSREIGMAIDALKEQGQWAFMLTLTIPHTSGMSAEESIEILYDSWKAFTIHGNKTGKTYKNDPFAKFCEEFNCKHRVRVGEFTYGKAGWHPHFHCLFWVDKDKFHKILQWEKVLYDRWLAIVRRCTLKIWNRMHPEKKADNQSRINIMYSKLDKGAKALYISKCDNKPIIQQSSQYLCGWGANRELTGNYQRKASHKGHMTPYQMLCAAYETDDEDVRNRLLKLYCEYMAAVRKKRHARINFSVRSGIKKIIADYEIHTESTQNTQQWRCVYFFDKETWSEICYLNKTVPVKAAILEVAVQLDSTRCIEFLLERFGIHAPPQQHSLAPLVEDIFNCYSTSA